MYKMVKCVFFAENHQPQEKGGRIFQGGAENRLNMLLLLEIVVSNSLTPKETVMLLCQVVTKNQELEALRKLQEMSVLT